MKVCGVEFAISSGIRVTQRFSAEVKVMITIWCRLLPKRCVKEG